MKWILKKLFIWKFSKKNNSIHNPIEKRILNIKAIWNNDHQDDSWIEKIIRLILSSSQLIFPWVYVKYLFSKIWREYEDLSTDFYVLLKVIFPFLILINWWTQNLIIVYFMAYLLCETILYIPTLIFASDFFSRPRSYKRSILLVLFNYMEIVVSFWVLYSLWDNMNRPFESWFDPIYFSIVCANSIWFGDYYPITTYGKVLVSIQWMFFLAFMILFINFFSAKVEKNWYFSNKNGDNL